MEMVYLIRLIKVDQIERRYFILDRVEEKQEVEVMLAVESLVDY